jgi:5-methylcytosine-specific restriction endonuclease McrA
VKLNKLLYKALPVVILLGILGYAVSTGDSQSSSVPNEVAEPEVNLMEGITRLDALAEDVPYNRSLYDNNWKVSGEKCTIRAQILESTSLVPVQKNQNCTVTYGKWYDEYSGNTYEGNPFGGDGIDNDIEIDHIVPLHYVNNHGGAQWSDSKKRRYGSSIEGMHNNLYIAVSKKTNNDKGDKGPTKWMPPNQSYKCQYLTKWHDIVLDWQISLDPDDYDYIKTNLTLCK